MDLSVISRTGGPVLIWRGPDFDRLDLTGPVVSNWVNKGVGLFGDYDLGPDFTLFSPLPEGLHWRELVAILSVLLAGGSVVIAAEPPTEDFMAIVPLGHEDDDSVADADEVFVFNPPALALSTPVGSDFIDVNSAIRAYPDVTARRLNASGTLEIDGQVIDWTRSEAVDPARPEGLLVSNSTPRPAEWPHFLQHLLGGGEVLLTSRVDDARIPDLADGLGVVHGTLGTWTK
ncbi:MULTISPECIES: hypothetical protein [unclassified Brevibacterium]|uniref:hypothetical protein n=1 Tax=unclassified Brevibacterium TaxID=2614124 RepID=UPI001093080F|nr:hypothetical protein [Brevibacterium sp. S22]TGD33341.1 hypothetical protein EB835_01465 [Brevibacterium sp. S22]